MSGQLRAQILINRSFARSFEAPTESHLLSVSCARCGSISQAICDFILEAQVSLLGLLMATLHLTKLRRALSSNSGKRFRVLSIEPSWIESRIGDANLPFSLLAAI